MELENQNEQPSETQNDNEEVFFFEDNEDSNDTDNQPNKELNTKYKELNKKFTQTSQENSKIKKELEEVKKKASELDEYKQKEAEKERENQVNNFKNNYSWLSDSSIKAISDLQKANPEKSLEEIAAEYGFLQEVEVSAATSRSPSGRSFVLPNQKEKEDSISNDLMRKFWYKTTAEVDKIRSEYWI